MFILVIDCKLLLNILHDLCPVSHPTNIDLSVSLHSEGMTVIDQQGDVRDKTFWVTETPFIPKSWVGPGILNMGQFQDHSSFEKSRIIAGLILSAKGSQKNNPGRLDCRMTRDQSGLFFFSHLHWGSTRNQPWSIPEVGLLSFYTLLHRGPTLELSYLGFWQSCRDH